MNRAASIPTHEQIAEFRVGAVLATQAIAVYIDSDAKTGDRREAGSFEDLPDRLKLRVLAACEDAFRRRKEDFMLADLERKDATEEGARSESQPHLKTGNVSSIGRHPPQAPAR